ncbi:MAG TPA: response regulator [Gemmata sp.]|jgi:CheY-like chemotaxis protein|nr:response regulator [Gemmata sp.]
MSSNHNFPNHAQSQVPQRTHAPGTTILLVEDEYAVREFVRAVLEQSGYVVVGATDGEHGLAEFAATPDRFALVLSDVIMPNRTGPELVEQIRLIRPEVPVIFMSAYTGGTSSTPVEMPSDVALLEKPFSLDQLLKVVTRTIGQSTR